MEPFGFRFSRVDRSFRTAERASLLALSVGSARGALEPFGFRFSRVDRSFRTAERASPLALSVGAARGALSRVLVVLTATALVAPPLAAAKTIELGWREDDGVGVMRFGGSTLTLANGRWSVRASFTNRSVASLRIERRFALAVFPSARLATPSVRLDATSFRPTLPRRVLPGRTWSGSFSGTGAPRRGSFVRVLFGRFQATTSPLPDLPNGFSWLTEHYHRVR